MFEPLFHAVSYRFSKISKNFKILQKPPDFVALLLHFVCYNALIIANLVTKFFLRKVEKL